MPPDQMDNPYGALVAFYLPRSFLERKIKVFLIVKDEAKATAHAMPDEVVGFSDILDDPLKRILFSPHHDRQQFSITYFPNTSAFPNIKNTSTSLELSCHPLLGVVDVPGDERPGSALSKDLNRLLEAGPDALEEKEKWQLLSRELA